MGCYFYFVFPVRSKMFLNLQGNSPSLNSRIAPCVKEELSLLPLFSIPGVFSPFRPTPSMPSVSAAGSRTDICKVCFISQALTIRCEKVWPSNQNLYRHAIYSSFAAGVGNTATIKDTYLPSFQLMGMDGWAGFSLIMVYSWALLA